MTREEFEARIEAAREIRLSTSQVCVARCEELLLEPHASGSLEAHVRLIMAQALNNLAKHATGLSHALIASRLFKEGDDVPNQLRADTVCSLAELGLGLAKRAIDRLMRVASLAERHGVMRSRITAALNIGHIHGEAGSLEQAMAFTRQALQLLESYEDETLLANAHNNLAFYATKLGDFATAKAHAELAVQTVPANDPALKAIILETRSHVDAHEGAWERALEDLRLSGELLVEVGNDFRRGQTLLQSARILIQLGRLEEADLQLRTTEALVGSASFEPLMAEWAQTRGDYFEALGQFAEALQYHKDAFEYRNRESLKEYERTVESMEETHRVDLAHQEAEILRKKNAELEASEERFQLAITGAAHGIFDWNIVENTCFYSQRFKELLGFDDSNFPAPVDEISELFHPDDAPLHCAAVGACYEGNPRLLSTARLRMASGEYRWFHFSGITVYDEHGSAIRMVGSMADISARKAAEEALLAAKQKAEENSELKSQFLANMSHEIRTPMNGVLGLTELMLMSETTEEQRDYLETIQSCGETLLAIINDILDFSKIEAGKVTLESEKFDVAHTVRQIESLYAGEARRRSLTLASSLTSPKLLVLGDEVRIRQVLSNLLSNALKFTERGGVELRVSHTVVSSGRVGIRFEVRDTGIGIAADRLGQIFESFTQADGSTTRRFGGTGLGLTISARLVELMDSKIEVTSELGHGSRFSFEVELPLAERLPESAQAGVPDCDLDASPRVLLVEDHLINRQLATAQLSRLGCRVTTASNGKEGLEIFKRDHFEMVFMDLQMPIMDGFEATRAFRDLEASTGMARTPIIALTANASPEHKASALEVGMDGHVSKPFVLRDLQAVLEQWTQQTASLRAA